ncbi:MAG: hypothetical protein ABSE66_03525 [Thermoplasmata archaeon]|jgi:hypothetical protein
MPKKEKPPPDIEPLLRVQTRTDETGLFYVESVQLRSAVGTFAARAVLVPWANDAPSKDGKKTVGVLFTGLPFKTLSILNLLQLQGKLLKIERSAHWGLYPKQIETLRGPAFERTLKSEYGPEA